MKGCPVDDDLKYNIVYEGWANDINWVFISCTDMDDWFINKSYKWNKRYTDIYGFKISRYTFDLATLLIDDNIIIDLGCIATYDMNIETLK